jgi:chromosome segregation protein
VLGLYLKGLEIKGFKSFADKIELEFRHGITGIVGPNGSGKSNIADAVRWVLGEQSAKTLRGGKMEDVIFAGTENRKAQGLAEVSLTIDNTDKVLPIEFSEITVTRRLYRSGESEYLINKIPYRLKDISELFMDTGIGKDGYSLIGQGKIDEILSTKSEDRRNLFEEAAGIVKYRTRKQEAEKKLENTEQNIIRITDIINELEEQIEPLSIQSETAKKYLTLREELKELEVNVILHNYDNNKSKLDKIDIDIQVLSENEVIYENNKQKYLVLIHGLKDELEKLEVEYREAVNIQLETEKSHENKQGNLQLLNERYDNLIKDIDRIQKDIEEEKKSLDEIDKNSKEVHDNKEKFKQEITKQNSIVDQINCDYEEINNKCIAYETEIENNKNELIQLLKENSDLNNKATSSLINIENIQNRKNQINKEVDNKTLRLDSINRLINENEANIIELSDISEKVKLELLTINNDIKRSEDESEGLKYKRNSVYDKLKTYEAKFNALNSMENDMEGFNRAVKSVINKYKDGNRVYGTISDLMEVPKGYEVAIETALAAGIQNIIIDNEHTAGEMIDYLKRNNLGRATFLPLTTIKSRYANVDKDITKIKGYLGIASDIVKFNEKYKPAISNLLGRIIICDGLSSAKTIAAKTDYNYRIVTLEGDVVNAGGSFTGGSTNLKNIGIFSRKNEISDLKNFIEKETINLKKLEADIENTANQINLQKNVFEQNNIYLQDITINYNDELSKLNAIKKEKTDIEEMISDSRIELEQFEVELNKNNEFIMQNKRNIDVLTEKQQSIERQVNIKQTEFKDHLARKEEHWNKITSEKIILAEKNKTLEAIEDTITQLDKNKMIQNQKIILNENLIIENSHKLVIEKDAIEKNTEEIKGASQAIIFIRHKISDIEARKHEYNTKISANEGEIAKLDEAINDLKQSIHKFEIQKSKIETETEAVINKLWDDYELTIPDSTKYRSEIKSLPEANRKLNELKNNIRELGDININSIEEYKRVKERYEFLDSQVADLTKAQESLIEIIEEMTAKMTQKFIEKFKIIRENFNYTFKELFGGGIADLKLEGEDVLNSGIEIIVQPPGKKLQSLSLLSGGERGLAAIALLFAILKMKPTPFCVLDEIEAALDDANVNRYAQFLRKYSTDTQFITITHRKGSMAVADALYGVTMEEKGISKMISLKLNGGN